jgi:exonuclease SbcC
MKFKRVEIQAFRAYNDVNDGTFDFTTESNEVADFISIYAPNGFGKTSFYDAVEWCYTNNISRLLRRDKDNLSSAKAEESNYILKNKDAIRDNKGGYVKLYLTSENSPIERKIPKPRSNQLDFKFKANETDEAHKYFQEVILSQEWIDAFLKEDDASERYVKFIRSFGDVNLDNKYKLIVELINHNEKKIKDFGQELKDLQTKFNFDFDAAILSKINSEIDLLNKAGEQIPFVRADFNEKDINQLANLISERITDLKYNISKHQEKIADIDSAITGNNISNVSIEVYFNTKEQVIQLNEKLVKLNNIKKQFEQLHETGRVKKNKTEELDKTIQKQTAFLELLAIYPKYQEIVKEIAITKASTNKKDEKVKDIDLKLEPLLKLYNEITIQLNTEIENQQKFSSKLNAIPELSQKLNTKNKEKESLLAAIDLATKSSSERGKYILDITKEIREWKELYNQIETGNYLDQENEKTKPFYDIINQLKANNSKIIEFNMALIKTEEEIVNINKLNSDIEQLITKGADIVNKNQLSVCPLCKQEYDNFETLVQKISNNTFLSEKMQNLLLLKSKHQKNSENLRNEQSEQKSKILNTINSDMKSLKEKESKEIFIQKESAIQLDKLKLDIQHLDDDINEIVKEIGGNDIEFIKTDLEKKIKELSKLLDKLKTGQENNLKTRKPLEQRKRIINEQEIPVLNGKIDNLKANESYLKIRKFLNENQIADENITFEFDKRKNDYSLKINTAKESIEKYTQSITACQKQLEKFEEEQIATNLQQIGREIESASQKLSSFEYFVKSELELELSGKEKSELERLLSEKNDSYKKQILQTEERIKSFEKTKEYKDNVLPFLKHEELKKSQEKILKDKFFLEKDVSPKLENEKRLLSEFIDKQIESFFHGKLINALYKKIDPHPKYKEISFKCDFSTDKPRLNVFVAEEDGKNSLVPTLYFSTAQLNILSLSIFLAKALNVKDNDGNSVDCIFIDDPIQSMDSINILSTIDLLRSIVVNMGKQIILATHDENFQNLLKKKIPSNKFKAKYIELETFGKVKQ